MPNHTTPEPQEQPEGGFTLVELLIVIALTGLASLVVVAAVAVAGTTSLGAA